MSLCKKVSHSGSEHIPDDCYPEHGAVEVMCCPSSKASVFSGEATRLQQLEVQVLGGSSTGFKNNGAAQQAPGVIVVVTSSPRLPSAGTSLP